MGLLVLETIFTAVEKLSFSLTGIFSGGYKMKGKIGERSVGYSLNSFM